jgi:hypothetical protein
VHEAIARYLQWPIYHHEHDSPHAPSETRERFERL